MIRDDWALVLLVVIFVLAFLLGLFGDTPRHPIFVPRVL
jgi:hypothetical protein